MNNFMIELSILEFTTVERIEIYITLFGKYKPSVIEPYFCLDDK